MLDEHRHVRAALAQRRQGDRDHLQTVEEILAEAPLSDLLGEVLVRRGDDADVDPDGAVGADRADLAVLEHPQQLHLQGGAHLGDLVEEDRAAVGGLKEPAACTGRTGEGATLVPEHLGLEEFGRDGAAVDGDEGAIASRTRCMDRAGEHLLAGAALAEEQDGDVRRRHPAGQVHDLPHERVLADQPHRLFPFLHSCLASLACFVRAVVPGGGGARGRVSFPTELSRPGGLSAREASRL